MNDALSKRAKEIIEQIMYVTVATVSADGQPWNTPVFSAHDDSYNFYWGSHMKSQHSQNITATGKVFLVIYDSTVEAGLGAGVYVQAQCRELTDPAEIQFAHQLIQARRPVPYWKLEQVQAPAPNRLYKAVPEHMWINSESEIDGHYIDTRVEIQL